MLVLSRRQTESIEIDGGVVVTVLQIKGNQVRIGIEAPKETGIRRAELKKLHVVFSPELVAPTTP